MWVLSLGWEDALEKEMAPHSSVLAWRIPWMESLVGYSPQGCKSQTEHNTHSEEDRIQNFLWYFIDL